MKRFVLAAITALALGQTGVTQNTPQSLADLAKQGKTERKTVKVFTDEDLPARSVIAAPAADTSKSAESAADPADKEKDAKAADTLSKSAPANSELKKKLDSYQQERDMWKSSAKRYEDLLANETIEFRREMYQDALANDKKNAALFQQKIDQTQAELAKTHTQNGAEHAPEHNSSSESSGAQP